MLRAPAELKALYKQGRLVPFIGAGVSMSVKWTDPVKGVSKRGPSWSEMVDQAAIALGFDPKLLRVRGTDLQILEYFKIKFASLAPLTNWLYAEMRPPDTALQSSPIHTELARLVQCSVYYTTNYDDFLERSLKLHGRSSKVIAIESDMGKHSHDCEVVKFHGDFNHPEFMVVSESDYDRRLSFRTPMDLRFRADVLGRAVLFLGYSFRDSNVSYLFHLVNEQLKQLPGSPSGRRAYIVVSNPSDFEIQLFRTRNIEVIPVRQSRVTDDIAELLAELRS